MPAPGPPSSHSCLGEGGAGQPEVWTCPLLLTVSPWGLKPAPPSPRNPQHVIPQTQPRPDFVMVYAAVALGTLHWKMWARWAGRQARAGCRRCGWRGGGRLSQEGLSVPHPRMVHPVLPAPCSQPPPQLREPQWAERVCSSQACPIPAH
jgi:hypothetical protein